MSFIINLRDNNPLLKEIANQASLKEYLFYKMIDINFKKAEKRGSLKSS